MKWNLGLLGVVAVLSVVGCSSEKPAPVPTTEQMSGTPYVVRDSQLGATQEVAGVAEPILRADLSTRMMARVKSVSVRAGMHVKAGQVLVNLDGQDLSERATGIASGVEAAQAHVKFAQTHANRMRALYADSATSKSSLEQAELQLQGAMAELAQVKAQSGEVAVANGYANLVAPFAGVVVARNVDPGALAAPGQPLLRIEDASQLRIRVTASNEMISELKPGASIAARLGGKSVTAVIEGIVPSATGNLAVVNALVANTSDSLRSSSVATLVLTGANQALRLIPKSALFQEGSLTGVWVRTASGDDKRWIRTGKQYGGSLEVLSGLRAGETILVPSDKGGK